ncbi:MAG: 23S rRNA (uracil(1939)-C(5))-methyltransferase RlmD [Planctomycetota bacterium]|jgi:23S rRNA (uracil1939-C5)-methyltransferase
MSDTITCPHVPACSGCPSIAVPYRDQLTAKLELVRQMFGEAGFDDFDLRSIRNITPSPRPDGYRNRVKLVPRNNAGRIELGLFRAGSHDVVDIPGCPVQCGLINETVEVVRTAIAESNMRIYDEIAHEGDLRFVTIRVGTQTGQVLVGLITLGETCPGLDPFARMLQQKCPHVVGLIQNVNPEKGNVIFGSHTKLIFGHTYLEEMIGSIRIRLGMTSFFQINTPVAEKAYQAIHDRLHMDRRTTLLDLYSGVGAIGLVAASGVYRVVGIEVVEEAVDLAEASARLNGIGNCDFRCGMVETMISPVIRDIARAGITTGRLTVVVNPPRKGMDPGLLDRLSQVKPVRMAYLSCEPRTLLRDLKLLQQRDYGIRHVELFDMFPQTTKIETLVILERKRTVTVEQSPRRQRKRT